MNKQELKYIMNDTVNCIKDKRVNNVDGNLVIITNKFKHYFISQYDKLPRKINIDNIELAIYYGTDSKLIYLKNGLKSYRKCKQYNLI